MATNEHEIVLRDSITPGLRTVAVALDGINRQLQLLGTTGEKSLQDVLKRLKEIQSDTSNTTSAIAALDKTFAGLTKTIMNPTTGLVAGMVAVGKVLDDFSVSTLRLNNTAKDIGVSVDYLNQYQQKAQLAGISSERATQSLGQMNDKLKEMYLHQTESPTLQKLQEANEPLARNLLSLMNQNKQIDANKELVESYFRGGPRYRIFLQEQFGGTASDWEAQRQSLEGIPKRWEQNTEAARLYHARVATITTHLENIKRQALDTLIMSPAMGALTGSQPGEGDLFFAGRYMLEGEGGPSGNARDFARQLSQHTRGVGGGQSMSGLSAREATEQLSRYTRGGTGGSEGDTSGWMGFLGGMFGISPAAAATRSDELDLTKESNKNLRDINDILMRMESQMGTGGGYPSGQARRAILEGPRPRSGAPTSDERRPVTPGGGSRRGGGQQLTLNPGEVMETPVASGKVISVIGDSRGGGSRVHRGTDIQAAYGTNITATSDGQTVTHSGVIGSNYGWGIKTIDKYGREHVYAHMVPNSPVPKVGDVVNRGTVIGQVGKSGNAADTVPHVHYEVRPQKGAYETSLNPMDVLYPKNQIVKTPDKESGRSVYAPDKRSDAGGTIVTGSLYGYPGDTGLGPYGMKTATGEDVSAGGIALPSRAGLNKRFKVTDLETGRSAILRQNDLGPFAKGRGIDFTPGAAQQLGLPGLPGNFPTDKKFRVEPADEDEAPREAINKSFRKQRRGGGTKESSATARVDFSGLTGGNKVDSETIFKPLDLGRGAQAGDSGGTDADYNRFAQ